MLIQRLLLIPLLTFACVAARADDRAVLVDISHADAAEVEAWRHANGVRWWLELGDELLLSGDVTAMRAAIDANLVLRDLGPLEADELVLHARGCSAAVAPADLLLWPGQRQDLLLRPDARRMAEFEADVHHAAGQWNAVAPNTVIERQFRLDRPVPLGADPLLQPLVAAVDSALVPGRRHARRMESLDILAGARHRAAVDCPTVRRPRPAGERTGVRVHLQRDRIHIEQRDRVPAGHATSE